MGLSSGSGGGDSGGGGTTTSTVGGASGPSLSSPDGGLTGNFSGPDMSMQTPKDQPSAMQQLGQGYLQGLSNNHPMTSALLKMLFV